VKRFALLLCFLVAACGGPGTETSTPPGATVYRQGNGGSLVACKPIGFDTICRGG
jgi:hypothetical protein